MKLKPYLFQTAAVASLVAFAPVVSANFLTDLMSKGGDASKTAKPLTMTTTQILGGRVYAFVDSKESAWEAVPVKSKKGTTYQFKQVSGSHGLVPSQIEIPGKIVADAGRVELHKPIGVSFLKNGDAEFKFGSQKGPVVVNVQMKAWDVSGLKMADYVAVQGAKTNPLVEKVGSAKFPEGSVAYETVTTFTNGEMVLPLNESFTNAKNAKDLIDNFSSVPYCLSYERRADAKILGVVFKSSGAKATSGTYELLPVRSDTIFCRPTGEKAFAHGNWTLVSTGHSSAVVLTMPRDVDPRDFGIKATEGDKVQFAFVAPSKGDSVFRPGRYLPKGTAMKGHRYLFNKTAADAINKAK